jgi:hypothetical protein
MTTHFKILNPINGDMLHADDGSIENGRLLYPVSIEAPDSAIITVNRIPATCSEGIFTAIITLDQYKNTIDVKEVVSGETTSIAVYRLTDFAGHYRVSIDDNIWFLQDIHTNEHRYTSIFDNPYLESLKKIHDTYGTKIHINLFYQTEGFNLSGLSDKFRGEWSAQADWIRLSFHALQEKPDMPYQKAGYDVVKNDCELVMKEIRRFAGEALMGPVTTLHWAEATMAGCSALRDAGYKGQLGYFNVDDDEPTASYYLDIAQRRHLKKRFIWRDPEHDIIFIRTSIVLDRSNLTGIVPLLDRYKTGSRKPAYADFLIHEQYFYPFYEAYQPDYFDKIETAVKWAIENDYTPAFLGDCILK